MEVWGRKSLKSGQFTYYNYGQTTNSIELWVSYEMEFKKPRIQPGTLAGGSGNVLLDHFGNFPSSYRSSITPQAPFSTDNGGMIAPLSGSTLGGALSGGVNTVITQNSPTGAIAKVFPVYQNGVQVPSTASTYYFNPAVSSGTFRVTLILSLATAVTTQLTSFQFQSANVSFTTPKSYINATADQIGTGLVGETTVIYETTLVVVAPNAWVQIYWTTGAWATTPTAIDFFVSAI